MLGAHGYAEFPELVIHLLHEGVDSGAYRTKVVFLELLALGRLAAKEGAAAEDEVGARLDNGGGEGHRVFLDMHGNVDQAVDVFFLGRSRVKCADPPAARKQRLGGSPARLSPPKDGGVAAHRADTHSA